MKQLYYTLLGILFCLPTLGSAQSVQDWYRTQVKNGTEQSQYIDFKIVDSLNNSSIYLYEPFKGQSIFINHSDSIIGREPNMSIIGIEFKNDKGEWTDLSLHLNSNFIIEMSIRPKAIFKGDSIYMPFSLSLWHPHFNEALYPSFEKMNKMTIRFKGQFYFNKKIPVPIYSEAFNLNIKPLETIDRSYLNWLNENKILYNYFSMVSDEEYYNSFGRLPIADARQFHNMTVAEIDSSMTLFPNSLMLGLSLSKIIDMGLYAKSISKDLRFRMLAYIGRLHNKALCKILQERVKYICAPLGKQAIDHSCKEYKELAPLYGLPLY